ncbi:MAG TPA: hypothetical protein VFC19_21395 [Candidatus Limnocylindrales bacterium]|nr:hypothetical protein [Candidatus Limnocylindrales bacterium]
MIRRIALCSLIAVVALTVVLALLAFTYFWRSPGYYLDVEEYPGEAKVVAKKDYRLGHPQPYIYESDGVLVYGSVHTMDPGDPQLRDIENRWRAFRPTVALVEGRLGFLAPGFMNPVKEYGEMGRVYALAKADHVTTYSWEQPWDRVATTLAGRFPPERVALYFVLRPYFGNRRFGRPSSPEQFLEEYLDRASIPALAGTIDDVGDVDRIWQRDFPGERDWRDVSDEGPLIGYLNDLANASEDLRNQHLVRVIQALRAKGKRVFVVCGSSHAVLIEPAVRDRE